MDLARLFETEAKNLTRFLRSFGGAALAEDLAQETFCQLYKAKPTNVPAPRAYLFATARNLALKRIKQDKRRRATEAEAIVGFEALQSPPYCDTPENIRIAAEDAAALRAAIAALPPMQRKALLLRRVRRLPAAEVARRLGVSERHMQRLVLQAIASCHARLVDEGDSGAAVG